MNAGNAKASQNFKDLLVWQRWIQLAFSLEFLVTCHSSLVTRHYDHQSSLCHPHSASSR